MNKSKWLLINEPKLHYDLSLFTCTWVWTVSAHDSLSLLIVLQVPQSTPSLLLLWFWTTFQQIQLLQCFNLSRGLIKICFIPSQLLTKWTVQPIRIRQQSGGPAERFYVMDCLSVMVKCSNAQNCSVNVSTTTKVKMTPNITPERNYWSFLHMKSHYVL